MCTFQLPAFIPFVFFMFARRNICTCTFCLLSLQSCEYFAQMIAASCNSFFVGFSPAFTNGLPGAFVCSIVSFLCVCSTSSSLFVSFLPV